MCEAKYKMSIYNAFIAFFSAEFILLMILRYCYKQIGQRLKKRHRLRPMAFLYAKNCTKRR